VRDGHDAPFVRELYADVERRRGPGFTSSKPSSPGRKSLNSLERSSLPRRELILVAVGLMIGQADRPVVGRSDVSRNTLTKNC
jgi:hypothetical protein